MDFSIGENNPLTLSHIKWLGFKNINGAFVHDIVPGEIQFIKGEYWYCRDNTAEKKLSINKDINSIYLSAYYSSKAR